MAKPTYAHLSLADHDELAKLCHQVVGDLSKMTEITNRAPYTDAMLRVGRRFQETMIDPLKDAAEELAHSGKLSKEDQNRILGQGIYPSINFAV